MICNANSIAFLGVLGKGRFYVTFLQSLYR